jgi:NADH/NAD ratio-sensing transcriptional regulator Rex
VQEMNGKILASWRRSEVLDLSSKARSQADIARRLKVNESTISRDLSCMNTQAKNKIRKNVDGRLPEEYEKRMVGLNSILREALDTFQQTEEKREKIQALLLVQC